MNKNRSFLLLFVLSLCMPIQSKVISLYSGDLTFEMADNYEEMPLPQNGNIGYYSRSGNKELALLSYRKGDFDVSKVLNNMDSGICNLSKYKLIETEKEYIWNLTTDYVIRKYISDSGQKFASFTRYVTKGAYCFGFWYNSDEEFKDFEKLIDSISFSEEKGFGQIKLALKYTSGIGFIILGLLIVFSFIAGAGGKAGNFGENVGVCLFMTAIIAILFLIPMWHFWTAYALLLVVFFIVCLLCASSGSYITFGVD